MDVTAWTCQRHSPSRTVPIGQPIANTQCYILDPQLRPLPIGEPGELHLGGVQIGRGYHNRPELTAEKFIPDPFRNEPGARLYKTGDLARYRPDGVIEYLGRIDHQVKIRGFRIELGEIEAALAAHSAVKQVVVVAREDQPGRKRLVAYLVGAGVPVTELRTWLLQTLPDYMVPAAFVWLNALPLSPNGKVDRNALPVPDSERPELPNEFVAPTTPAEQTLAEIWSKVLGVKSVGIHDSFFELGGDSIRAIQVLARAQAKGLPATLAQLFETPTIHGVARHAGTAATTAGTPVAAFDLVSAADRERLPAGLADAYPATLLQVGMFYHNELHPASAVYHDVFSFRIQFPFVADKLHLTLQQFAARHPTMRTAFNLADYAEPLQLVHQSVTLPLTIEDLRERTAAEQTQRLTEWIAAEKHRAFDRTVAPLLRVHVQLFGAEQFQLIVSFHHAVLDGWSLATMLTEVLQDYAALIKGTGAQTPAPTIPYREYVASERQAIAAAECRQFWSEKLADANVSTLPRWPKSYRAGGTEQVRSAEFQVPAAVYDGLKKLAQTARVPLKSVLQAAHYRVMSFLHGQPDVISGSITNGRPEDTDGERMIGLFLNTVPVRLQMAGGSWIDLCQQVFAEERALLPHRRYPLAEIQKAAGGQTLFESAFDFVHFHVYRDLQGYQDMGFMEGHYFEANSFILFTTFMVDVTTTALQFHMDYDPEELCATQIQAFGDYYANTLAAMVAEPSSRYEQFSPLAPAERQKLLGEWNATSRDIPQDQCLHQLFEAQVERSPDAVAVVFGNVSLTYTELNNRANQLAHRLRALGVGPDVLVGLCVERSVAMIAAMLAIHKAGGAYVPLDPAYPAEWLAFVLADTQAPVLVTESKLLARLPKHSAQVVCLDAERWDAGPMPNPTPLAGPHNLAYVIYTSGSTGKPKGVAIEHRSPVAFVSWARDVYPPAELAGVLASTSICFDLSIFEIFFTLSSGGKIILAENALALPMLPAANEVTLINTVPSAIKELLRQQAIPASVRVINLAGEPTPVSLVQEIHQLPHVQKIYDLYGPSETTTYSTFALRRPDGPATIGRPIANTQIYLLDAHGQPVPIGVPGEIFIGGAGVARGYLNRPDLTAEKFIVREGARLYRTGDLAKYLPDGNLEFLGRCDRQVKIRGFRIELGEVQARLQQYPQIREVVVVAREDTPGEKRLVAYFVTRTEPAPTISELREFLQAQLPGYMVPTAFVKLAALPLTPNGKIDQRALPKPETGRGDLGTAYTAPRTEVEQIIAGIWQDVLQVERVGLHDNFFDLGGHSLHLVRVHGKLCAAFQTNLPLLDLFQYSTVTGLAQSVRQGAEPATLDARVWDRAQLQRQAAGRRKALNTLQRTS